MFIALNTLIAVRSSGAPYALMRKFTCHSSRSGSNLDIGAINMWLLRSQELRHYKNYFSCKPFWFRRNGSGVLVWI